MRRSACALRLCREWHAGQPPMRASTCNEALCCALRSALCLGQPLARGVDVQLMRRSALQRLASESLRGVQSCRRLAYCVLSYRLIGAGTSAASRRVAVLRDLGSQSSSIKRILAAIDRAQGILQTATPQPGLLRQHPRKSKQ